MLVGLTFAAPRPKATTKDPVYFPTTEGTTLVYQFGAAGGGVGEETQVVTKVEDKDGAKLVHVSNGGTKPLMVVRVSKDGLELVEEVAQRYDPAWLMFKMPPKPDDKWDSKSTRPDIGTIESSFAVGKPEQLVVPAGTYTAIPVTVTQTTGFGASFEIKSVYWYVENIGWAKITLNGTTVKELKSVKHGNKK
jgi:hypothetical protein